MKNFLNSVNLRTFVLSIFLAAIFTACKKDDSPKPIPPTTEPLAVKSGRVGDLVQIKGTGFSTKASDNIVKFNGKQAEVTEATTTLLKTKVPLNATTGPITVTVNLETVEVGQFVVTTRSLYIFHDSEKKLARINIETGELTYLGNNITYGINSIGAIFHPTNNEYIGFDYDFNNDFTDKFPYILRIKLSDGTTTKVPISNNFLSNGKDFSPSSLTIDNNNNVYVFHKSEKKLAKINITDGSLTYIGSQLDYIKATLNASFDNVNGEYVGVYYEYDENLINYSPYILRIKVSDGTTTKVPISNDFLANGKDFKDIVIDSLNNSYSFHKNEKKLAKLNIANGSLAYIGNNITYGINTRGAIFNPQTNEYIGFDYENDLPQIVRIKLSDGSFVKTPIPSSFLTKGKDFSDFIIAKDL